MMAKDTLTGRQSAFVKEYLLDHNGTQAAIRAGYSPASAKQIASENLSKYDVSTALEKREAALTENLDITVQDIIRRAIIEADGTGPDTSSSARTQANNLLAKVSGLLVERRENINLNISRPAEGATLTHLDQAIRLIGSGLSDERIEELIQDAVLEGKNES